MKIIIPIFTIPYISRVLGPNSIGINSYTYNIIQYFVLLGSIGITIYGNRKIAYVKATKSDVSNTFWEIFTLQVITVFISYLIFFVFLLCTNNYHSYYLAQSIMIIATAFDVSWFFMGVQNFRVTFLRNLVIRILVLILIFSFVKNSSDLLLYIILYTSSYLIGNVTMLPMLRFYITRPKFRKMNFFKHFYPSVQLFIPQIAGQVYGLLNKNILGIISGVTVVGYFDQSDKVSSIITAIVTATGAVMLPYISSAYAKKQIEKVNESIYTGIEIAMLISVPFSFGLSAVSINFVPLFFTKEFTPVIPVLMVQAISCLVIAISNVVGLQYLLPTNRNKAYMISIIVGAFVNLILDIPLIYLFGAVGSAASILFAELGVTLSQLYFVRKDVSYMRIFKFSYKYIIAGLTMFLIVFWINYYMYDSWINLFISICIGALSYFISLNCLRVRIIDVVKKILVKQ